MLNEIREWWDKAHKEFNNKLLSFSDIGYVFDTLCIKNYLDKENITVLEVGVGIGKTAFGMFLHGFTVDIMDVSPIPLERLKYARNKFLFPEDSVINNEYDLIISHLVAQHMTNEDLDLQLSKIIPSLKKDGIFSMQFYLNDIKEFDIVEAQKFGGFPRTLEKLKELVEKNNGKIVFFNNKKMHEAVVHIKKGE